MKTVILVNYEEKPSKNLFLRGEGLPELSWEKGIELSHVKEDIWMWETESPFSAGEFKILIDDQLFEIGENHPLLHGASIRIRPKFKK